MLRPENEMLLLSLSAALFIVICAGLGGCTTTKTVYVPVECPKPVTPAPPVDYMAKLSENSKPSEFVKACLATRISGFNAYDRCAHVLKSYQ